MSDSRPSPSVSSVPPIPEGPAPGRRIILPLWASRWWAVLLLVALSEVVALGVRGSRVAEDAEWVLASEFVRTELQEDDAITGAPRWTDPLVRLHLGDKISTKMAGRVDLSAFDRLWVLSVRGAVADEAPRRNPDFVRSFGRVTVSRYDFGPSPIVVDLADQLAEARVTVGRGSAERACTWNARARKKARGGLGFGPVFPRQRFECGPRKWNWVGNTVMEDMDLQPRRCIWQHPVGRKPLAITFPNVHLGTHLVMDGGLYFYHERDLKGADVHVAVTVDGRPIGRIRHRDGEGFKRWRMNTHVGRTAEDPARGDLRVEVTSKSIQKRSFCWAGSIRNAERREGP